MSESTVNTDLQQSTIDKMVIDCLHYKYDDILSSTGYTHRKFLDIYKIVNGITGDLPAAPETPADHSDSIVLYNAPIVQPNVVISATALKLYNVLHNVFIVPFITYTELFNSNKHNLELKKVLYIKSI